MNSLHASQFDLNLLRVLHVLLEERSVTRAAKRLHRTQSAISHSLARLREGLNDAVFLKIRGRLEPTPRAQRLAPEVSRLLLQMSHLLSDEGPFETQTSRRVFTSQGPDFMPHLLPCLYDLLAARAPHTSLEFLAPKPGMLRDVAEGVVDLGVAPSLEQTPEGLSQRPLAKIEWAVFARRYHPGRRRWNLKTWATFPHVAVRTPSETESPVEVALKAQKTVRKIGAFVPHFLLAPPLLSDSNLLMTAPRVTLEPFCAQGALLMLPCPLKLPPMRLSLYWSQRLENEPGASFFRATVLEALESEA